MSHGLSWIYSLLCHKSHMRGHARVKTWKRCRNGRQPGGCVQIEERELRISWFNRGSSAQPSLALLSRLGGDFEVKEGVADLNLDSQNTVTVPWPGFGL